MAAYKISELVPLLVDHFICETDSSKNYESTRKLKDDLTKSVYKRLYTRSNSLLIDANVIKEGYSAEESIKDVIQEMELVGNYTSAESLSTCLKQLSDGKGQIRENVQVCLRFLIALFNLNSTKTNTFNDTSLDEKNENSWTYCYEAKWYDGSASQPGVLHMYPRDIFEVEDPFAKFSKTNQNMPSSSSGDGLELWTEGMRKDLQQMSPYSRFPTLNEFNLLRYNSIDDPSQIGSEYSSWNTPSDDDDHEYSHEESISLPSMSISGQSAIFENVSPYLLLTDAEIFSNEKNDKLPENLTYEDSFFHCKNNRNYFLEQEFQNAPFLLRAKDIANLLIGLSSESFSILKSENYVNVFPGGENDTCSGYSMLQNFISTGQLFVRLSDFSHNSHLSTQGSVIDALKCGITKYLLFYELTVSNTLLENLEHMSVLDYQFEELCENLKYVAQICGFEDANLERNEIPTGVDFIDYLYEMALAADTSSTYPTLMFLMKHSFSPYLRFLQHWLFEGVCDDLLDEFRLQKNAFYEKAKDESYWMLCYTITDKKGEDFTPIFLKPLAEDILICGKSFNLLKRCCPGHLLFSFDLPSPDLELGFTEYTACNIQKKTFCAILSRISHILQNLERKEKNLYDENLNPIDSLYTGLNKKLRLHLLEAKSQIECSIKNIFPESEISDILVTENQSTSPIGNAAEIVENSDEHVTRNRRKSWPQMNDLNITHLPDSSAGILLTSETYPSTISTIITLDKLSLNLEQDNHKEKSDESPKTDMMSSFSSFIYDEVNNPLMHDKKIISVDDKLSEEKAIDRLTQQLMSDLLNSKSIDINKQLFHWQHISSLVKLSFYPVMQAQIDLVNKCILDYFFDVLQINNHFILLMNFFGLCDGEFGDSLCGQLSNMVEHSKTVSDVFNSVKLNSVLAEALANSINGEMANINYLTLRISKSTSQVNFDNMLEVLKFITLEYEVQWPCNIIITETQLSKYNKVLVFMLEITHTLSVSKQMWLYFKKLNAKYTGLGLSPQFRKLQLYRHEMQHFIKAFKCYIASEVYDLAWHEFQQKVKKQIMNFEDLRNAHSLFISTMNEACLLNLNSQKLLSYLRDICKTILRFNKLLTRNTWYYNSKSCQYEHKAFTHLDKEFQRYRKTTSTFCKIIMELCHQKYQMHLEHLLLTVDFNSFYKRTN